MKKFIIVPAADTNERGALCFDIHRVSGKGLEHIADQYIDWRHLDSKVDIEWMLTARLIEFKYVKPNEKVEFQYIFVYKANVHLNCLTY